MIPDYTERKHEYSFAKDRQLQNKLLAADDIFDQPKQTTLSAGANALRPSNLKDSKFCEVTGWCPDDRLVLRRPEHENILSKPRTSMGAREYSLARDRSKKETESAFSFYHYPESHRYIEQYRREHTCTDSTNSASTRNEFLELQRFYAYKPQAGTAYTHPTTVGYPPQVQSNTATKTHPNGVQHRHSDSNLRSASRYRLSPSINVRPNESDAPKDSSDQRDSPLQLGANATGNTSKMAVHAVSKTPIPKVPAKVTVPANASMISPGLNKTLKARKTSSAKVTVAAWESTVGAVRTLDTLACVANPGDKLADDSPLPTARLAELPRTTASAVAADGNINATTTTTTTNSNNNNDNTAITSNDNKPSSVVPNERISLDSESSNDAVSFDRLSTTCLGADVAVKSRLKLEPSCTYHVFPSHDLMQATPVLYTASMLWNPAKSTLERGTPRFQTAQAQQAAPPQFDPGLPSAFKNVVNPAPVRVPDKELMVKEFINDLKPLNLPSTSDIPRLDPPKGIKGSGTKPDLPPSFELQGVSHSGNPSSRQTRPATQAGGARRAKAGRGKLRHREAALGERKSQSAHSTASSVSASNKSQRHKPLASERDKVESAPLDVAIGLQQQQQQQQQQQFVKFWNNSQASRGKAGEAGTRVAEQGRESGGLQKSEMTNLRQIAELMLANEQLPGGELEAFIQRRANQSFGGLSSNNFAGGGAGPSIASGVKHNHEGSDRNPSAPKRGDASRPAGDSKRPGQPPRRQRPDIPSSLQGPRAKQASCTSLALKLQQSIAARTRLRTRTRTPALALTLPVATFPLSSSLEAPSRSLSRAGGGGEERARPPPGPAGEDPFDDDDNDDNEAGYGVYRAYSAPQISDSPQPQELGGGGRLRRVEERAGKPGEGDEGTGGRGAEGGGQERRTAARGRETERGSDDRGENAGTGGSDWGEGDAAGRKAGGEDDAPHDDEDARDEGGAKAVPAQQRQRRQWQGSNDDDRDDDDDDDDDGDAARRRREDKSGAAKGDNSKLKRVARRQAQTARSAEFSLERRLLQVAALMSGRQRGSDSSARSVDSSRCSSSRGSGLQGSSSAKSSAAGGRGSGFSSSLGDSSGGRRSSLSSGGSQGSYASSRQNIERLQESVDKTTELLNRIHGNYERNYRRERKEGVLRGSSGSSNHRGRKGSGTERPSETNGSAAEAGGSGSGCGSGSSPPVVLYRLPHTTTTTSATSLTPTHSFGQETWKPRQSTTWNLHVQRVASPNRGASDSEAAATGIRPRSGRRNWAGQQAATATAATATAKVTSVASTHGVVRLSPTQSAGGRKSSGHSRGSVKRSPSFAQGRDRLDVTAAQQVVFLYEDALEDIAVVGSDSSVANAAAATATRLSCPDPGTRLVKIRDLLGHRHFDVTRWPSVRVIFKPKPKLPPASGAKREPRICKYRALGAVGGQTSTPADRATRGSGRFALAQGRETSQMVHARRMGVDGKGCVISPRVEQGSD